jgi:hypothetical protein
LITSEGITHVTLVTQSRGRLAPFARPTLADRLLDRHPHLDVHLMRAT